MAGVGARINADELKQEIARLRHVGRNFRPVLTNFGEHMMTSIARNFEEQGRPERWEPLKPATKIARWRRRNRGRSMYTKGGRRTTTRAYAFMTGMKILQDTGALKKSIHRRVIGNILEIGTGPLVKDYARIQQKGGQAGRGRRVTIPARPFILFQEEDEREFLDMVEDHIFRGR